MIPWMKGALKARAKRDRSNRGGGAVGVMVRVMSIGEDSPVPRSGGRRPAVSVARPCLSGRVPQMALLLGILLSQARFSIGAGGRPASGLPGGVTV